MLAIGLMSGTALDGVDAALVETDGEYYFKRIANFHLFYPAEFQARLKLLIETKNDWLQLEHELTIYHINCVLALLDRERIPANQIAVIGFHGQTIYHNPAQGITWQIGNPHLLAQRTKINVVSDFRRRDIACAGQGAPLVPIFHQCLMQNEVKPVVVLNIGGVANISYIDESMLLAFDTGPGNALINDAMLRYYNKLYDEDGITAKNGIVQQQIVSSLLDDEFFAELPPKSLDRNYFSKNEQLFNHLDPADVIATLTKFTVSSIVAGLKYLPAMPEKIYVCGGGVHNSTILKGLRTEIGDIVFNIKTLGLDADFIEAQAFAYLAVRNLKQLPSTFPSTTAVNQETLSGVLFLV